jgi:hypothetical protein
VQRAARDRAVDQPDEVAVLRLDSRRIALADRRRQPFRERLDRRAVAEVLEPLLGRDPDALLLLFYVRLGIGPPRRGGARER